MVVCIHHIKNETNDMYLMSEDMFFCDVLWFELKGNEKYIKEHL